MAVTESMNGEFLFSLMAKLDPTRRYNSFYYNIILHAIIGSVGNEDIIK
jgi:hypothetical protein